MTKKYFYNCDMYQKDEHLRKMWGIIEIDLSEESLADKLMDSYCSYIGYKPQYLSVTVNVFNLV